MSSTIEQKVVEMRFDNSNFEKNVSDSMSTLDRLKEKLENSTSGNAFAELGKAANNLNFDSVAGGVQTITDKFSILEEIASGALRNIGAHIQEYLVSSLKHVTLDNVISGWGRYAQKTESMQTILSAIADEDYGDISKIDYVEGLLEKLAWFSDETSYNFTDMTDNISKFTAAGLDLDKSTNAMIGIANWAANAGQNASTASRAMYQLSQAMGTGEIRLMDWKSVETANMATKEVKNLLIDYGKLMGAVKSDALGDFVEKVTTKGIQRIEVSSQNFRETLKEGWLTADIFTAAMAEYSEYSNALYEIIQNPKNAKIDTASELMRFFDKAIEKSKETGKAIEDIMMEDYEIDIMIEAEDGSLRSALENVTELGIRAMKSAQQARTWAQAVESVSDAASTQWSFIFERIFGNVEEATILFTDLAEYMWDKFVGPLVAIKDVLTDWKELGGRDLLFVGDDSALSNIMEAIDSIQEAVGDGIVRVFPPKTAEDLYELTERFRDFTERLILSDEAAAQLSDTTERLAKTFKMVGSFASSIGQVMSAGFGKVLSIAGQLRTKILDVFDPKNMRYDGSFLRNDIGPAAERYKKALDTIKDAFTTVKNKILDFIDGLKLSEGALERIGDILTGMRSAISLVGKAFGVFGKTLEGIDFKKIGEFVSGKLLEFFLMIPSAIGRAVSAIENFISTNVGFRKFVDTFSTAIKQIKEFITGFIEAAMPAEKAVGIFGGIKSAISGLFEAFKESKVVTEFAEGFRQAMDNIKKFFEENVTYEKGVETFNRLKDALSTAAKAVKEFVENSKALQAISEWFSNLFNPKDVEGTTTFGQKIVKVFETIWEAIKWVGEKIAWLWTKIGELWDGLGVGDWIKETFSGLGTFFKGLKDAFGEALDDITNTEQAAERFQKAIAFVKNVLSEILTLIGAALPGVAVGAGGVALANSIKGALGPLTAVITNISDFFQGIVTNIKAFRQVAQMRAIGEVMSSIMRAAGEFLLMVAGSLVLLSGIKDYTALGALLAVMGGFIAGLFAGINMLLSLVSSNSTALRSAATLYALGGILKSMGIALLLITVSVKSLAGSIKSVGDLASFGAAIAGVAVLIGAMGAVIAMIVAVDQGNALKGIRSAKLTILALAACVAAMSKVVIALSAVPPQDLLKGLLGVTYLVIMVRWLSEAGNNNGNLLKASVAMLIISGVIASLAGIAYLLGLVDKDALIQGGIAIAAIGLIMEALIFLLSKTVTDKNANSLIKGAAAILVLAGALDLIVVALAALTGLVMAPKGVESVFIAIGAMAAALLVLIGAAYLAAPAAVPLAIFSAGILALGLGLKLLAEGLVIFMGAFAVVTGSAALLSNMITTGINAIFDAVLATKDKLIQLISELITMLLDAFIATKERIVTALIDFVLFILDVIEENGPVILEKLLNIVVMIWDTIVAFFEEHIIPDLAYLLTLIVDYIFDLLDHIRVNLMEFISDVIDNIFDLLDQIKDRIVLFIEDVIRDIEGLIADIIDAIVNSVQKFIDAALTIMQAFADGILDCIDIVVTATEDVIKAIAKAIVDLTDTIFQAVVDVINGLAESIETHSVEFWSAVKRLCRAIVNAFLGLFLDEDGGDTSIWDVGWRLMDGLKNGIVSGYDAIKNKVTNIASGVINWFKNVFGIQSPSRVMRQFGEYLDEGLAIGIKDASGMPENAAKAASENVVDAMSEALLNIDSMLGNDDLTPTITPVMDLSQIQNGFGMMSGMFDSYGNYSLDAAMAARYNPYVDADGKPIENPIKTMGEQVMSLQEKFDEMLVKLGKLRVVLDSGTLVGELVEPMDEALGRRAVYVGRSM